MDVDAFTKLVREHQAAVAAVAFAIVGDRAIALDLTQEAFVTAWRKHHELREPAKARAWLCGIVRLLARDHRRIERRRASLRDRHVEAAAPAALSPTPLDEAIAREDEQLVAAVIRDLPASYREPLLLHYVAGCSVAEIAELLSLREDAVKQRLSRARASLRDEPRFAAAALGVAPLPGFTDATVQTATTSPPLPAPESFMSAHPILTVTLAGALAAGGLAIAASRDRTAAAPVTAAPAGSSATPTVAVDLGTAASSTASNPSRDRAAVLAAIRTARARTASITVGAAPPAMPAQPDRSLVYDFAGETVVAGDAPQPPSDDAHAVLDKHAIRAALSGARAEVLACYESALARTADLAGTIAIRIVIEGEPEIGGVVSDASITDVSTISDPVLSSCILDAVVSIDLPAPEHGTTVTVHYPITFAAR